MIAQIDHLITGSDVAKEALKFIFGLLSTAIGFFLALFFNKRSDENKEKLIFKNIKKSLLTELIQNQYVIEHSFYEYIDGVILNDLDISISCFQLTNNQFQKYSDHELLTNLQLYIHQCRICNKQKNQLKDFRINENGTDWEASLQSGLMTNIKKAEACINALRLKLEAA